MTTLSRSCELLKGMQSSKCLILDDTFETKIPHLSFYILETALSIRRLGKDLQNLAKGDNSPVFVSAPTRK